MSFDPATESVADEQASEVPTRASRLGASGLARNPTISASLSQADRARDDRSRPAYSKSYLDELKGSTPSTPKDPSLSNSRASPELSDELLLAVQSQTHALDIAAKFGVSSTTSLPSAIPSAAEIQEKKDRRLRLAREQNADALSTNSRGGSVTNQDDFISLDAYNSDGEFKLSRLQLSTHIHDDRLANAQEYTRLVPEDEDIAEGFEAFIDDDHEKNVKGGRIHMGMKKDDAVERRRIRELINDAEGGVGGGGGSRRSSDDESDESGGSDSDASASHAYMAAQTSHGVGFSHLSKEERRRHEKEARRPRAPEKTVAVPTLAAGLARLRELQSSAEFNRQRAETRKVEIRRRLAEVEGEKGRIQSALEELGRQLEESSRTVVAQNGETGRPEIRQGGLEDIGAKV